MKNVFIQLTTEEAIAGKKEFLSAQVNMLELLKRLKAYKTLRRRELLSKEKIIEKVTALRKEQKELEKAFPPEFLTMDEAFREMPTRTAVKAKLPTKEEFQEVQDNKNIEAQLKDIRDKLAQLG